MRTLVVLCVLVLGMSVSVQAQAAKVPTTTVHVADTGDVYHALCCIKWPAQGQSQTIVLGNTKSIVTKYDGFVTISVFTPNGGVKENLECRNFIQSRAFTYKVWKETK